MEINEATNKKNDVLSIIMSIKSDLPAQNKYCKLSDLSNEASVESFFVLRLLADLEYKDSEIRTKKAIDELKVPKGRKRELYRPDYLIVCTQLPRWIIDAKATNEKIEDWTYQCAGYSLEVNRKYKEKPLHFYMITNGLLTRVYRWDQEEPVMSLRFSDFSSDNPKYQALHGLLGAKIMRSGKVDDSAPIVLHKLRGPREMAEVKKAFVRCHQIIWDSPEGIGPHAAFLRFLKLLFVKLWEDRRLRNKPDLLEQICRGDGVPASEVRFSRRWIEEQEKNTPNPVATLLFQELARLLDNERAQGKRKRIFDVGEQLDLSPGIIKRVVEKLENLYLFGVDEDLNGRMFETFLVAEMRGKKLGQFFTPRSVVHMMVQLAQLHAGRDKVERVLDGSCGTGGFLIEALTEMRGQVWNNKSLSDDEKKRLLNEVSNEAIFGIDVGSDPNMARIARLNMYLHGDGGSRVYMTDALKPTPRPLPNDDPETRAEVVELQKALAGGLLFDVVLTNPPFSKTYKAVVPEEKQVLNLYMLATYGGKVRSSLRSSVMFIERYWNLLRPGGRLLMVIDDEVLSGSKFAVERTFIRNHFIIRAIISLSGDAFQQVGSRAKTSVLYLIKRVGDACENQPSIFRWESRYVGLDDVPPKTRASVAEQAMKEASEETREIMEAFLSFLNGDGEQWVVTPERIGDRLDVKNLCRYSAQKLEPTWQIAGADSDILGNLVVRIEEPVDLIPDKTYIYLKVRYNGEGALRGESSLGREITYRQMLKAKAGDIVISKFNAVNGAVCVFPADLEDCVISPMFYVLRVKPGVKIDPWYLWAILVSPAVLAEWLSDATGVGRHPVEWETFRKQSIPLLPYPQQKTIGNLYRQAREHELEIPRCKSTAREVLAVLGLDNKEARERLARAKPPK